MDKEKRNKLVAETIFEHLSLGGYNGFCSPSDLKAETHLQDDLGADSLDEVELVMVLEEQFDIEIDDVQAEQIKTIGDVYNLLDKIQGEC